MKKLRITIGKKSYDVTVEVLDEGPAPPARPRSAAPTAAQPDAPAREAPPPAAGLGSITSPMAGVIKSIHVKPGDSVTRGQELAVLEAMKMENPITAPESGSVKSVDVTVGQSVTDGQVLVTLDS